jgi:hypothetical protein
MGSVCLARDTKLDRLVAVKFPKWDDIADPTVIQRFYREARAAATLQHPNLCPVYDAGETDGRHYLTMGYIEGRPLSAYVASGKTFPEREIAALVRKLALAMQQAHSAGVVHRDLKPDNIMINRHREPVIVDFGLARRAGKDVQLTQSGATVGTPAYMAPEQMRGDASAIGPACDIYSLGTILYELLTRRRPFVGDFLSVVAQVVADDPLPPSQLRPDLSPALESICLKALAKKPEDRFASMQGFADALGDFLRQTAPGAGATGGSSAPQLLELLEGELRTSAPAETVPLGLPAATLPFAAPVQAAPAVSRESRRRSETYRIAAGVVAIGFGGYQALYGLANLSLLSLSAMGLWTGFWSLAVIGLSVYLAILGIQVLKHDLEALKHASGVALIFGALIVVGLGVQIVMGFYFMNQTRDLQKVLQASTEQTQRDLEKYSDQLDPETRKAMEEALASAEGTTLSIPTWQAATWLLHLIHLIPNAFLIWANWVVQRARED